MVKMIQDLRKRMESKIEKMQEMFTKDLEELKNKWTEINNTPEGINRRITDTKEGISDQEERMVEITATKQSMEKKMKRSKHSLWVLWDNIKGTNIRIIGVSEGEGGFPGAQLVNNPLAMQETLVQFPGREDPLEKG